MYDQRILFPWRQSPSAAPVDVAAGNGFNARCREAAARFRAGARGRASRFLKGAKRNRQETLAPTSLAQQPWVAPWATQGSSVPRVPPDSSYALDEAEPLRGLEAKIVEEPEQLKVMARDDSLDPLDTQSIEIHEQL